MGWHQIKSMQEKMAEMVSRDEWAKARFVHFPPTATTSRAYMSAVGRLLQRFLGAEIRPCV